MFLWLFLLLRGLRLFVQIIFPQALDDPYEVLSPFMLLLEVPQAVEVLSLKQDSVVHRCLEGIKARQLSLSD